MISERGGKIQGMGPIKRGRELPKNLSSKGGPREFGPQIQNQIKMEYIQYKVEALTELQLEILMTMTLSKC